jgi:tetratricopeptide (TPR) repeat protein
MKNILLTLLIAIVNVSYADPSPPMNTDPQWLVATRLSVKSGKFEQAIKQLQDSNQVGSAEWNNLMGYSLRQKQPSDLVGAENYYQAALKIDPKHKGALEYYGMLMLLNNNLPGAEALLVRLDKVCFFGCEEYSDLKEAIKIYKLKK